MEALIVVVAAKKLVICEYGPVPRSIAMFCDPD